LEEFIHDGKTLIIVSHARRLIRSLCTRAIWLDKGRIRMDGDIKEVLNTYEG
jgi:ABC-type polysaccharide/polyol phosphate transport system ATPase subunit